MRFATTLLLLSLLSCTGNSASDEATSGRLTITSLVGVWDCTSMIITLGRSGRHTLEYQPRGMGGSRGTWRVPTDFPNTLVLEDATDPVWMADIETDANGDAVRLIAFSPFQGRCSK